ncbi:MAG TPA: glycoside hydrolase family 27 protein [Pelobium sp.]|nr:glycoside hydrolase family 27 protein [Pelobium sp.]
MMKKYLIMVFVCFLSSNQCALKAQEITNKSVFLAKKPPLSWMTWNFFADNITEADVKEMADAMVSSGMVATGYEYIIIDDGWQGGRDNRNNIIADSKKFPSGIKALAGYVHERGLKLGIYSDAALLTCAGYTASLGFEEQDAKTFASWDIDYLKYDYCHAPDDMETAKARYKTMANALKASGRNIVFGICEWGGRKPWLWAAEAGGQLWRTTNDVRDKWQRKPGTGGEGIIDILDENLELSQYAGPGHWNDFDMLIVGLYGKKGPSGDLGGIGCTDTEYQSQMSLWSILNSPLTASNDIRNMNAETKRILLNKQVIGINQDELGLPGVAKVNNKDWTIILKTLANGEYALAILNRSNTSQKINVSFKKLGLTGGFEVKDLWQAQQVLKGKKWNGKVRSHETKLFRLIPVK